MTEKKMKKFGAFLAVVIIMAMLSLVGQPRRATGESGEPAEKHLAAAP